MVTFEGTADDVDVANETLTVAWESDQDGIFGASAPDVSGTIAFDYDGLTLNTHLITMTVSDERGETCADTVTLEIGTPPEVTIDTPADNSLLNDDIAASFSATVSDQRDAADALTVRWESDVMVYCSRGLRVQTVQRCSMWTLSRSAMPHCLIRNGYHPKQRIDRHHDEIRRLHPSSTLIRRLRDHGHPRRDLVPLTT